MNKEPFTYENSKNPWLLKDNKKHFIIDNYEITAEYMWTLNKKERISLLNKIFKICRQEKFFNIDQLTYAEIEKTLLNLKKYNSNKVLNKDGYISNSGILGLKLCRYICQDLFYKAKGDNNSRSVEDVFYNDKLLLIVLKNRMGWNSTREDGEIRPYLFDMSKEMIIKGIHSSGLGYNVSNFRPSIAKFIYEKYLNNIENPTILDYSAGWGARMLAAYSINANYIGIDPLTANNLNKFAYKYLKNCYCIKSGSENKEIYKEIKNIDMCFSCPPYFTLEIYSNNTSQSVKKYSQYKDWLNLYWKPTVQNCISVLKQNGIFGLVIKDKYRNFKLKEDMCQIIEKENMKLIDIYQYKTTQSHLSKKRITGKLSKNNEYILIYKKI